MTQEGAFGKISRSWISKDVDDTMSCYMSMTGRISLSELISYLNDVVPDMNPAEVYLNWATVKWLSPATEEEKQQRAKQHKAADERHAEWERKMYVQLKEKFEGTDE